MAEAVRWGILGAAKIAREFLAPAIHISDRGVVAAVASRSPGKAEPFAVYPGLRVFDDYDAMLADPGIDAVYIPLPNSQHVEWTARCLRAGKHVLCEKPIALRAEEIDPLIALRDETGLLAAEAFMVTHHPQWRRVRELVDSGAIGTLRLVQGAFSFFNADAANIRNMPELGGGALRDIGVYPSVTTRFVTGAEPVSASAVIDWDMGIDATATARVAFPGFLLDFYVSMRMAPRQQMVFHGDKGFVSVTTPFNARVYGESAIELRAADGVTTIERFPAADQYRAQIDAFNAAVLDGADYACPLEFSRGNQRMIDMIYDAARG
ncbi:Gfo/Idh/MocA family protein [Amaricoccus solimangrovi]|uniref:Gfo/Idh/MocA family oxidoreductase n=1 Tax=Amaricoccus solimangrovi TaxID=2589815 RepID=A0A501WU10_9RHOB|nr:Gfo/Idh/MocA family oxidoreductase [Amaricoccus solimangrovi]TPE52212.1 Gfo/Idh/MocA family oxidoreductase [Amaricoccus solimangrovi]